MAKKFYIQCLEKTAGEIKILKKNPLEIFLPHCVDSNIQDKVPMHLNLIVKVCYVCTYLLLNSYQAQNSCFYVTCLQYKIVRFV